MKKTLLALILLFGSYFMAIAQTPDDLMPRFSGGIGLGSALGSNTSNYPLGMQLNLKFEYPIPNTMFTVVLASGLSLFTPSGGVSLSSSTYGSSNTGDLVAFFPFQVGTRYYIKKFFVEGLAGLSLNAASDNVYNTAITPVTEKAALITPSVGYGFRWGSTDKIGLDLSAGYEARLGTPAGGNSYNLAFFKVAFSYGIE